ncbi:MAG TPA: MerR family transcriptional regulator, partial [Candidatus Limnocylindria bacterium]|nr:MerR family transcriptional regulator [Candidatus Limnocylindria bacterium]
MAAEQQYTIADLARLTGVNVRTIRYYLAQGLLPASGESGPGAHYGQGHLDRLRLTKRLQEQHQPLAEIRQRLAEMTDEDVAALAAESERPSSAPTSALDYVRSVLGGPQDEDGHRPAFVRRISIPSRPPVRSVPPAPALAVGSIRQLSPPAMRDPVEPAPREPAEPAGDSQPPSPTIERSQWERLSLG